MTMRTRREMLALAAGIPFVVAAAAQEEPIAARRKKLFERLSGARTEMEGRVAEDAVWRFWMEAAPGRAVAAAIDQAMDARESYDFDHALEVLDGVVSEAPEYSEGWNQRAFIRFLKEDLDGSLEDIDRTLELEPKHFAALAGKAMILMRQGRMDLGQAALRRAVEIHPWLKERSMLTPPPGEVVPDPGKGI